MMAPKARNRCELKSLDSHIKDGHRVRDDDTLLELSELLCRIHALWADQKY